MRCLPRLACAALALGALVLAPTSNASAQAADPYLRMIDIAVSPEATAGVVDEIAALGRAQSFAIRLDPAADAAWRLMMYDIDMTVAVARPRVDGTVRVIVGDGPYQADEARLELWDGLLATLCAAHSARDCTLEAAPPAPRTRLIGAYTVPVFSLVAVTAPADAIPALVANLNAAVARHGYVLRYDPEETTGAFLEIFYDNIYAFALRNPPPYSAGFRIGITHGAFKPTVDDINFVIESVMAAAGAVPRASAEVLR